MKRQNIYLLTGVGILAMLLVTYFIPVTVESGPNYNVISPLLGLIIFYQVPVLVLYILIGFFFIYKGVKGRVKLV